MLAGLQVALVLCACEGQERSDSEPSSADRPENPVRERANGETKDKPSDVVPSHSLAEDVLEETADPQQLLAQLLEAKNSGSIPENELLELANTLFYRADASLDLRLDIAQTFFKGNRRHELLCEAFRTTIKSDLPKALETFDRLPIGETRRTVATLIAGAYSESDWAAALAWAQKRPYDDVKRSAIRGIQQKLDQLLSSATRSELTAIYGGLVDSSVSKDLQLTVAEGLFDRIRREDGYEAALAWLGEQDISTVGDLYADYIRDSDPSSLDLSVATDVVNHVESRNLRIAAIRSAMDKLGSDGIERVLQWADTLSDRRKPEAQELIMVTYLAQENQAGPELLESIGDQRRRDSILELASRERLRADNLEGARLLSAHIIDEEVKSRLLETIAAAEKNASNN